MIAALLRSVTRQPLFDQQLAQLEVEIERLDEALRYAEFVTATEPHAGNQTRVPGIWIAPVRVPRGRRIVRASIFYTFTDDEVVWQAIRLDP